jgi:hypothetical protein
VVHHVKENNFFIADGQDQAPTKVESDFVELGSMQAAESKSGVHVRVLKNVWNCQEDFDDPLPLKGGKVPPTFDEAFGGKYRPVEGHLQRTKMADGLLGCLADGEEISGFAILLDFGIESGECMDGNFCMQRQIVFRDFHQGNSRSGTPHDKDALPVFGRFDQCAEPGFCL